MNCAVCTVLKVENIAVSIVGCETCVCIAVDIKVRLTRKSDIVGAAAAINERVVRVYDECVIVVALICWGISSEAVCPFSVRTKPLFRVKTTPLSVSSYVPTEIVFLSN